MRELSTEVLLSYLADTSARSAQSSSKKASFDDEALFVLLPSKPTTSETAVL